MTQLNRACAVYNFLAEKPRYLARGDEPAAKQQSYMLRDLLEQHCGLRLQGGDITDAFALLCHGMDWAGLMANLRGESAGDYYGIQPRDVKHQKSEFLRQLIKGLSGNVVRAILDMPCAQYQQARTMAGARLATLLAGQPSWTLAGGLYNPKDRNPDQKLLEAWMIFDGRTDKAYVPTHFSSDPMTNAERVHAIDWKTREEVDIPIEEVRYTRLHRANARKEEYALDGHTRSESSALSFYGKHAGNAMNYALARNWFNAGNDITVIVFHGGSKTTPVNLRTFSQDAASDFDNAIHTLREFYGMGNVVLIPKGLDDVRDPAERWAPSFKHTLALMPDVVAADADYQRALDRLTESPASKADELLRQATRAYNEVLIKAVEAFWLDTREINGRSMIFERLGTPNMEEKLCFAEVGPLTALRELIGLDARGNPREKESLAAALRDPQVLAKRVER